MLTRFISIIFLALSFSAKANIHFPVKPVPGLISKLYGDVQFGTANIYWKLFEQPSGLHFIIQKSENGKDFTSLDTVKSNDGINFQYKDTLPLPSAFYRIKAEGHDTSYSDIMRLSTIEGLPHVKISPSLFDVVINVEVSCMINETFNIVLTNSRGEIVNQRELNAEKGPNKVVFDDTVSFLYADEYTITITGNQYSYFQKLYKK